ncbi:hypothetical protein M426DRAFT_24014 [Hypoxylon sp. CI-4A]|nr:hypothetical protein M426DRAFT_24014 [Hypoxylon sp. CI-4A]
MADPLSMVASVVGVAAFGVSTARTIISLIQEIADAPDEIVHIRCDVQNLSSVFGSIQSIVMEGQKQAVRLLLRYGANKDDYLPPETREQLDEHIQQHQILSSKLENGITPLLMAGLVLNDDEMTNFLLEHGADPTSRLPSNGNTPLTLLTSTPYLACAKVIIEAGADVHIHNHKGRDPFRYASERSNIELGEFMLAYGYGALLRHIRQNPIRKGPASFGQLSTAGSP